MVHENLVTGNMEYVSGTNQPHTNKFILKTSSVTAGVCHIVGIKVMTFPFLYIFYLFIFINSDALTF
jgi:hypothetical protein